jgi:hypothetical protein
MSRMDPEDARQGKKGTPVLRVLISALILCAIVAVGMAIYGWAMPDATIGSDVGTSPSTTAPAAAPATPPAN